MLNAWTGQWARGTAADILLDCVVNYILPGLDAQGTAEAKANFVGLYNTDMLPNTSITIGYKPPTNIGSNSPLVIEQWTDNGTDVLKDPFFNASTAQLRLEPSVANPSIGQAGQDAFQAGRNIN